MDTAKIIIHKMERNGMLRLSIFLRGVGNQHIGAITHPPDISGRGGVPETSGSIDIGLKSLVFQMELLNIGLRFDDEAKGVSWCGLDSVMMARSNG